MKNELWLAAVLTVGGSAFGSASTLVAAPASVQVHKSSDQWTLSVDSQPFYVKGISCNDHTGAHGEDFLKMAADAGANSVRIYGDVTPDYLNGAAKNGLKVDVGIWLNAIRLDFKDSYRDPKYCATTKAKALAVIHAYKDHPAVLMWTLGNEVFSFTEDEKERKAFGYFLEDLVQAAHKEDPRHPVVYASSYSRCLPYLQKLVPSIDIIGVNVTGGAGSAIGWADQHGFDKPVLVTEFAPFGAWEQRRDANGMPYDPPDQFKADNYRSSWRQMQEKSKRCIGGFAFVLSGLRNQDSLTWYNMNYEGLRRFGYWTVYEIYTGKKRPHAVPMIVEMTAAPVTKVPGGSMIDVHVKASDAEPDQLLKYDYFLTDIAKDPLKVEKPTFFPPATKVLSPGHAQVKAPSAPGNYRVYGQVTDSYGNTAIADRSIVVGQ